MLVVIGAGIVSWPQLCLGDTTPSIVVLPFTNMSGDAEQNYLADGITEDMTTDLASIPGLLVISRNAAVRHEAESIGPAQLAEELGARYILEGSVRRAGNELRINARLFDANGGGLLWAERFDGAVADVYSLHVADERPQSGPTQGECGTQQSFGRTKPRFAVDPVFFGAFAFRR